MSFSHATDADALKIDVDDHHLYIYHLSSYQQMCYLSINLLSNQFDMLYDGLMSRIIFQTNDHY
jgi:hypothetical protein